MLFYGLRTLRRLRHHAGWLLFGGLLGAGGCTVASGSGVPMPEPWDGATGGDTGGGGSSSSGGFNMNDASSCQPGSLATYHPDAYHPASGRWQGKCVPDAQGDPVAAFYTACLSADATVDGCNLFRQQNADCVACILTGETAAKYGPILNHGGFVTANVAGCLELAGDQQPDASELPCAKAVQALAGCELAACEANCAVHDAASLAQYDACATSAEGAGCQTYATAATCAEPEQEASALGAACLGDFQTFYQVVVPLFCGPPPASDGGGAGLDGATPVPPDGAAE